MYLYVRVCMCVWLWLLLCSQGLHPLLSLRLLSVRNARFDERSFEFQFQRLMGRVPSLRTLCLGPFSTYIPHRIFVNLPPQVEHLEIDM